MQDLNHEEFSLTCKAHRVSYLSENQINLTTLPIVTEFL